MYVYHWFICNSLFLFYALKTIILRIIYRLRQSTRFRGMRNPWLRGVENCDAQEVGVHLVTPKSSGSLATHPKLLPQRSQASTWNLTVGISHRWSKGPWEDVSEHRFGTTGVSGHRLLQQTLPRPGHSWGHDQQPSLKGEEPQGDALPSSCWACILAVHTASGLWKLSPPCAALTISSPR